MWESEVLLNPNCQRLQFIQLEKGLQEGGNKQRQVIKDGGTGGCSAKFT